MTNCLPGLSFGIIFTPRNLRQTVQYFASMLHLLHITDILNGQCAQSLSKRRRPQGEATMRDRAPKKEASPVAFIELLRISQEKVNKPVPNLSVPQPLTPEELKARPSDAGQADDDENP